MQIVKVGLVVTVILAATAWSHATPAGKKIMHLEWRQLVPPDARFVPKARRSPFDLGKLRDPNPLVRPPPPHGQDGQWMSRPARPIHMAPKVVSTLDGKRIRIGGYIVPLDFDAKSVKEFLLVPFVGACIHVPPPPPNQIIYVKTTRGFKIKGLFDPVYVTGVLKTKLTFTGLAQTGYSMQADKTEMRVVQ